jgi:hypothetical protein
MPKASRTSASQVEDAGVMEGHYEDLGGYMVGFETFREDTDSAPLFKGLPDDRCQAAHWGYVQKGSVTFKFADHDETYDAGDAYYAPPGHTTVIAAGTDIVEFSEVEAYNKTMEVAMKNLAELQSA